jgi:predicted  nucleic acid-binding Zn-ribbon protein
MRYATERELQEEMTALTVQMQALTAEVTDLRKSSADHQHDLARALALKEEEHRQHLAKVDDRIRKMLAAKDLEVSNVRAVLRAKEAKLKTTEDTLARINSELVSVKKRP